MTKPTMRTRPPYLIPGLDLLKLVLVLGVGLTLFLARNVSLGGRVPTLQATAGMLTGARTTVSGMAAPGSIVNVYTGDTYIGTTTARADGSWNLTLPLLSAGQHQLTARSQELFYDVSSSPISVDVAAPAPIATAVPATTQVQAVATDAPQLATLPVIYAPAGGALLQQNELGAVSGTANFGNTITLYDWGNLIGETTVDRVGRWTLPLPALSVGQHRLQARAEGADGQSIDSAPIVVNVVE